MPTIDVGSPRVIITYTVLAENLSQARHLLSGLGRLDYRVRRGGRHSSH